MSCALKIAPSILSADFTKLASEIEKVERAGCDMIHIDVMDGHFVPNITVGPFIVKAIRRLTRLPLDTHLMIENPEKYIAQFVEAGSDGITVHVEACSGRLDEVIQLIRSRKVQCGLSLKPATPLAQIEEFLTKIDLVLVMTVNPGFGGQSFMPEVLPKIEKLRKKFSGDIEVDGGINGKTAPEVIRAGANVLVAGTAIFGREDVREAMTELRGQYAS
jgi:ribulose-phosphate 3-epimerase